MSSHLSVLQRHPVDREALWLKGRGSLAQTLLAAAGRPIWASARPFSRCSQGAVCDCLFLTAIVFISAIRYLPGLGFYDDDWDFLRRFSFSQNQSIGGLFQAAYFPLVKMRPVQILYLSGLY